MVEYITKYWLQFILTACGSIIVLFWKKIKNRINKILQDHYKVQKEEDRIMLLNLINEALQPIQQSNENQDKKIKELTEVLEHIITSSVITQRVFLDDLCTSIISRGYVYLDELDIIHEHFEAYDALDGNHTIPILCENVFNITDIRKREEH